METFSYQHSHFNPDSVLLPSTAIKMPGFFKEGNTNSTYDSHLFPSAPFQQIPLSDNEHSLTEKQKTDSSSIVDELESGDQQLTQKVNTMEKKRKSKDGSYLSSAPSKDSSRQVKGRKQKKSQGNLKDSNEKKLKVDKKNEKKVTEGAPTDYIHVRARRGQATDSHSLAERVRREKISERMKLLQALVPGCDKITGKAVMLDEIINYVQSLQNQLEFLSMKLASVNPIYFDLEMELGAFMVGSSEFQKPSNMGSPLSPVQPSKSLPQPTAFADTANPFLTTTNNYPLLDSSASILLLQQEQRPTTAFPQDNGDLLWDLSEQRQKLITQSGFDRLCSFQ